MCCQKVLNSTNMTPEIKEDAGKVKTLRKCCKKQKNCLWTNKSLKNSFNNSVKKINFFEAIITSHHCRSCKAVRLLADSHTLRCEVNHTFEEVHTRLAYGCSGYLPRY